METASTFLKSIPRSDNPAKWGLSNTTVFGPGFVSSSKQADSPLTYDAIAEVWCEGNTLEGHPVKLKRTVVMSVVQGPDSKWQVTDYTLTAEEPLSYWKQVTSCVVWGILVPLLIFSLWLFGLFVIVKFAEVVQWQWLGNLFMYTFSIGGFIILSMWIKAPLECFGSWVEAALFWIVSLSIVGVIVLGIHKARKLARQNSV